MRSFTVEPAFGGAEGLAAIREALRSRGIRLLLDFIPNHLALDHRWTIEHPERFVRNPDGSLAHGRDPYFPPWTDTVQLDYRRADVREAMTGELLRVSALCDGVRCDMAMLVLREVFCRTWGGQFDPPDAELWPAAIGAVRRQKPDFVFLAEVYWGLDGTLRSMGFDFTYDKPLYDRLRGGDAAAVREHLRAPQNVQRQLARFVENHDEERAATAFAPPQRHRAAATLTLTLPGLRLLHDGQMEGRKTRIPIQLLRRPEEEADPVLQRFYARLLPALRDPVFNDGEWRMIEPRQAWEGNPTHQNFVAFTWTSGEQMRLVAVNLAGTASQCYLPLDAQKLAGSQWYLYDLLNDIEYQRNGDELLARGLYLNVPAYFNHLFAIDDQPRTDPVHAAGISFLEERGSVGAGGAALFGMAWSPDGETLAFGDRGNIRFSDDRHFSGHEDAVGSLSWSPDGRTLVSGSDDHTVVLWQVESGQSRALRSHDDHVVAVAFAPDGRAVASGGLDRVVIIHDPGEGTWWNLPPAGDHINALAWSPDGSLLACGSGDQSVYVWDVRTRRLVHRLAGGDWVSSAAWSADGSMLAAGTGGGTVDVWDARSGHHLHICEGHTERILSVVFSPDGRLLVSKSADGSVRFWDARTWQTYAVLEERGIYLGGLAFSSANVLATRDDGENRIRLWHIDPAAVLRGAPVVPAESYKNAKVVLVGDSGVGKTALAIRLVENRFGPTAATDGTWATQMPLPAAAPAPEVEAEVWLWDFAGQADYRLVHQLYMDETSLALFVFDPQRNDALQSVVEWDRDMQRAARGEMRKLLVAARTDIGHLRVNDDELKAFLREHGFAELFSTSAKTNAGCDELREAVIRNIPWDSIPSTVSPRIFRLLKEAVLRLKDEGRVLVRAADLKHELELRLRESFTMEQLRAVIGLLSGPGVVWRLEFGDFVLLQPERINSYAAAVIRAVRAHPQEIGCISEEMLLRGQLDYGGMTRLAPEDEAIVLHAMYETLVRRGFCLREHAEEGTFLIFPSLYRRARRELEGEGTSIVSYRFDGPLDEIYATLIVRLHHSAAFGEGRLWRFAADFPVPGGKRLGLKMTRRGEGSADIEIHAQPGISPEMTATFIGYVHEHLKNKARNVERSRHYVCGNCDTPVVDLNVVRRLLDAGSKEILCQLCRAPVPIWDMIEESYASDELRKRLRLLDERANAFSDTESLELNLVGNVYAIVSRAGQIYRQYTNSDHGIDGEIELKDDQREASGKRLYLQLKSGDSHLSRRRRDGAEVFRIKKPRHATFWQQQPCPVMLVIGTTDGRIRWMDISDYLKRETEAKGVPPKQIVFEGEPFTPEAVREYRRRAFIGRS